MCKAATLWDGVCLECTRFIHTMQKPVVPYVPKRKVVYSRKNTFERDKIMARMMAKDKEPFASPVRKHPFWQPVYTGESATMAKIVMEQAKRLFWNVPRPPEGQGSFFIGQITSNPMQVTRPKADKSGTYQTWEFKANTKVQLADNAPLATLEFTIQDMMIGGALKQAFPVIPGKVSDGPVAKFFGVFYDALNRSGYYAPDVYAAPTVEEVIADMNGAHLERMRAILGDGPEVADWRFSLTAYTPKLSDYLREQGATDDIPF